MKSVKGVLDHRTIVKATVKWDALQYSSLRVMN